MGKEKYTIEKFIQRAIEIHGDRYNYDLVNYIHSQIKVIIICKIHGEFEQAPYKHLANRGCPKCAINIKKTHNNFLKDAKLVHNNKYSYNNSIYVNDRTKLEIICKDHNIFLQTPNKHLQGHGCPKCKISKGEDEIIRILDNNNIIYIKEYKFIDCINIITLPFDFYIPSYNICIEYDGEQHYKSVRFGGIDKEKAIENLKNQKLKDEIKTNYCITNNIKLIRIPYWKYKKIEKILIKEIHMAKGKQVPGKLFTNAKPKPADTKPNELKKKMVPARKKGKA